MEQMDPPISGGRAETSGMWRLCVASIHHNRGDTDMANESATAKHNVQDLLTKVDRFLASPASNEALGDSRQAIDSAVASLEKAERIDLETLKLTVTA